MNLEVIRADPHSPIEVGRPWSGFGLAEQRFPVQGDGWQLWGITRLDDSRTSRIIDGMPLTAPFGSPHALAQAIADSDTITEPRVDYAAALRFVLDIGYAPDASLVGTRWVRGILGAVQAKEARDAAVR